MRASSDERLNDWLRSRSAETQHLEFKQDLVLGNKKDKIEVLKDLTGMGNGGSGVVVFGVAETKTPGGESVADRITELTDPAGPTKLKDITSSGVRPTLRVEWSRVEQPNGGYVIIADVEQSPLGPYMVDAYDEHRYWCRVGTDVRAMSERLVHDMYAEAERWQHNRELRWQELQLPLTSPRPAWPWLTVSGIPEFDVGEPFDPARRDLKSLRFDAEDSDHARLARLEELGERFTVWADGFISNDFGDVYTSSGRAQIERARCRVHRDGSIGMGALLIGSRRLDAVRVLNAQLSYCAQLWALAGVSAVDLQVKLSGFGTPPMNVAASEFPQPPAWDGAPAPRIVIQELIRVDTLAKAGPRHRFLRRFGNRLANLYGESTQRIGFDVGPLCTPTGTVPAVAGPAHIIYTAWGNDQPRQIAVNGALRHPSSSEPFAWWQDGALLDMSGDILAVVEFANLDELPAEFVPAAFDPAEDIPYSNWEREPPHTTAEPPVCSGRWSSESVDAILKKL